MKDIANEEELAEFYAGIDEVNGVAKLKFKMKFADLSDQEKDAVLTDIAGTSSSAKKSDEERAAELANEGERVLTGNSGSERFFNMMRELTITGYFTSEIGAKQALKFDEIPGSWQGCIPYEEVGGSWAM